MNLEETILDKVRSLPPAGQERVLRFASRLQQEACFRTVPFRDRRREMDWVKENRANYADQWVVVKGDRLIATAKAAGVDIPFLIHVLPDEPLPFIPGL